jgi:FkbM family methyltransferase
MRQINGAWFPDADHYFTEKTLGPDGSFQRDHLDLAIRMAVEKADCPMHVALDCGAHVGTWTRILAEQFIHVWAIEPAADCYACLVENTKGMEGVFLLNAALGEQEGYATLCDDITRPGNTGSRYTLPSFGAVGAEGAPGQPVKVITIDSLGFGTIDFVKIDVEGNELAVLKGGHNSFLKFKPTIIMEVKDLGRGVNPREAVAYLEALGARDIGGLGKDRIFQW